MNILLLLVLALPAFHGRALLVGAAPAAPPEAPAVGTGASPGDERDAVARELLRRHKSHSHSSSSKSSSDKSSSDKSSSSSSHDHHHKSDDTDSPTMFPTLNPTISPTISPTLSPTLFPTVSPTFCGKAAKSSKSGDYYYSGKSKSSKSGSERRLQFGMGASEYDLLRQGVPFGQRDGSASSKSSKSGKSDYYYSGSKSGKGTDCTQGSRGSKSSKSGSKSGSRRLARRVEIVQEEEVVRDAERSTPGAKFEPDSVRRRRINRAA